MRSLYFAVGHAALAAADSAQLTRGGKAGPCPFDDQFALHLGKAGHDVEEEATGGCLRVDAVGQAATGYLLTKPAGRGWFARASMTHCHTCVPATRWSFGSSIAWGGA